MKSIQIIIFLVTSCYCLGQNRASCIAEYEYLNSEGFKVTAQYDTILHCNCGYYREYDSLGILMVEGNYTIVDSVQCKDCYYGNFLNDSAWRHLTQYYYSELRSLRVGLWKYYHSNGLLKMSGKYSDYAHELSGTSFGKLEPFDWYGTEIQGGPINGWIDFQYLKDGIWMYFSESGKKEKVEFYIDGILIYTESY